MVTSYQTSEAGYRMLVNWISLPCKFMHFCVFHPPPQGACHLLPRARVGLHTNNELGRQKN